MLPQNLFIIGGSLLRIRNLGVKTKDVFFGNKTGVKELLFRLEIIAGAMVGRHMTLISKKAERLFPGEIAIGGIFRQRFVKRHRRIASRKSEGKAAPFSDGVPGLFQNLVRNAPSQSFVVRQDFDMGFHNALT